jgi:dTDP-4-dehydrorhamnose 3,5-epimerase
VDERGVFTEIIRKDWKKLLESDEIAQVNFSITQPGIIRAWHRHARGQVDYFLLLKGAIKVCAYDDQENSPTKGHMIETFLSEYKLQILRIPGKYWHGFKVISPHPAHLLYVVNKLYDYTNPDEERRPWNDLSIVPIAINGNKEDPRVAKPWDWNYPPHR